MVYKVTFHYKREVVAFIEAEEESDIDGFFVDNPDFNILEDYPELIESDATYFDLDSEEGDYELTEEDTVETPWCITPNHELVER